MAILVRRLLSIVPTLLVLSAILFLLLELAPGDATMIVLDDTATESQREQLRSELGLQGSIPARYLRYLVGILKLNFGLSARSGLPVSAEILKRLPPTIALVGSSLLIGAALGAILGTLAATWRDTIADIAISGSVSLLTAIPIFWLAMILIGLMSVRLGWLPVLGIGGIDHLVLPAFCASLSLVPGVTRITRASLIETANGNFVSAALARGIGGGSILIRHIAPAALRSIVDYIGIQAVRLVTSIAVMETIFARPGLGSMIIRSAFDRDGTVLIGASLVIAFITFLVFLIVDFLLLLIDPRLRQTG